MTNTEGNISHHDQLQVSQHSEKEVRMIKYFTITCNRVVLIIINKTSRFSIG